MFTVTLVGQDFLTSIGCGRLLRQKDAPLEALSLWFYSARYAIEISTPPRLVCSRSPFLITISRSPKHSSVIAFFFIVGPATTHQEFANPANGCPKHQDGGCPCHAQECCTSISRQSNGLTELRDHISSLENNNSCDCRGKTETDKAKL